MSSSKPVAPNAPPVWPGRPQVRPWKGAATLVTGPTPSQLARSHRASRKGKAAQALARRLDEVLGPVDDDEY